MEEKPRSCVVNSWGHGTSGCLIRAARSTPAVVIKSPEPRATPHPSPARF
jgi:hypothetical protein